MILERSRMQQMDSVYRVGYELGTRLRNFSLREWPLTLTHRFKTETVPTVPNCSIEGWLVTSIQDKLRQLLEGSEPQVAVTISRNANSVIATVTLIHL